MKIGIAGLPGQTVNYEAALRRAALNWETPVQIEVSLSPETALGWDALLLPGGGDISPAFLPGCPPLDPACAPPDPALDEKQLRLLENGIPMRVVTTAFRTCGVDTPEDLEFVRREMERRAG